MKEEDTIQIKDMKENIQKEHKRQMLSKEMK